MQYTEKVMEAFQNPKNVGEIENYDGMGMIGSEACGDATSSTATEMIKGMTVDEALEVTNKKVIEVLGGLPPQKIHCSVLAEQAIKAAIEDYKKRSSHK